MIAIATLRRQRFDSAALAAAARACCAVPLRRAGAMTELVVTGVHACLDGRPALPTAVIWGSRIGIRQATARVVSELCIAGEPLLPFDFLATQPALAAVPVQQTFRCVTNAIYQPWQADTGQHWARMLHLALAWLRAGRHARVLCGQVEPGADDGRGDWLELTSAATYNSPPTLPPPATGCTDSTAVLFDWLATGRAGHIDFAPTAALPALRFARDASSPHCRLI